jgi:phosphatidylserine/phosphatidylglycerophosphate/cardiolipin synthase-like enzyme
MLALASTAETLAAVASARSVSFSAYLLHPGALFDALDAAARRGAKVVARVEESPYRAGSLARLNARMLERLRRDGADARAEPGVHAKTLIADGVAYYDDANWLERGGDTILRDPDARDPAVATTKGAALDLELRAIEAARAGDAIDLETESFGNGPVSGALERAAGRGARVRVLVSRRELRRNAREAETIAGLERAGAEVRSTGATEKFAVVGERAWVGSANATYGAFDQSDWGAVVDDAPVREHCASAFASRWGTARREKAPAKREPSFVPVDARVRA